MPLNFGGSDDFIEVDEKELVIDLGQFTMSRNIHVEHPAGYIDLDDEQWVVPRSEIMAITVYPKEER